MPLDWSGVCKSRGYILCSRVDFTIIYLDGLCLLFEFTTVHDNDFSVYQQFTCPLVIDRFPLKRILVQSQWWKTILLVCLGIYITSFNHGFSVAVIFFIAVISLLDGVAAPVSAALVPQLVPKKNG